MEIKRTHDSFYLKENYRANPKEYFKLVKSEIDKDFSGNLDGGVKILDIGCETGSFLYYLRSCYPDVHLYGMDVMKKLLDRLNEDGAEYGISTYLGDISDKATLPDGKFQIITMLGVMSIFDDFKPVMDNMMSMLDEKGTAYIFGIFNPENLDVLIKSKNSEQGDDHWESGWNYFSRKSVEDYCGQSGWDFEFIPFEMPFAIEKHADDPLRSWTEEMANGHLQIVNGLQLVHQFYVLKIRRR